MKELSCRMGWWYGKETFYPVTFHIDLVAVSYTHLDVYKRQVLDRVESSDGTLVEQYEPEEYGTLMTTDEAAILKDYMNYVDVYKRQPGH